jgi:hypothetical protein
VAAVPGDVSPTPLKKKRFCANGHGPTKISKYILSENIMQKIGNKDV